MATQIPLVDYLVLGDDPHLVAHECTDCGARYFDRRNACASCGGDSFKDGVRIENEGELLTYTIVGFAAKGVPVPYVAAVVRCGDKSVAGNIINTAPDPAKLVQGMKVKLATFVAGTDSEGTEAIGFGYEPA